jgi:hypothetical protein
VGLEEAHGARRRIESSLSQNGFAPVWLIKFSKFSRDEMAVQFEFSTG